jgi:hypothetical protein
MHVTWPNDRHAEVEKLRKQWHGAEDAYDFALREGRAPNEVEVLRERKERLKAAYLEMLETVAKE